MADINKRVNIIRAARDSYIGSSEEAKASIEFVTDLVRIQLKEMQDNEPWAERSIETLENIVNHLSTLDIDLAEELDELD